MWSLDRVAKLYYLIMECENARLNERDFLGGLKKGIVFAFAVLKKGLGFKELRGTLQEPINQER